MSCSSGREACHASSSGRLGSSRKPTTILNFDVGTDNLNLKSNEYLYRRLDLADAVDAHILAAEQAQGLGFGRCSRVSATSPFEPQHLVQLRADAPGVVRGLFPDYGGTYGRRNWQYLRGVDRSTSISVLGQTSAGRRASTSGMPLIACGAATKCSALSRGPSGARDITRGTSRRGHIRWREAHSLNSAAQTFACSRRCSVRF